MKIMLNEQDFMFRQRCNGTPPSIGGAMCPEKKKKLKWTVIITHPVHHCWQAGSLPSVQQEGVIITVIYEYKHLSEEHGEASEAQKNILSEQKSFFFYWWCDLIATSLPPWVKCTWASVEYSFERQKTVSTGC